jgi:hypothetical protein
MAAFVDRDITQLHEIFQTLDAVREQMESVSWGIPKVSVRARTFSITWLLKLLPRSHNIRPGHRVWCREHWEEYNPGADRNAAHLS